MILPAAGGVILQLMKQPAPKTSPSLNFVLQNDTPVCSTEVILRIFRQLLNYIFMEAGVEVVMAPSAYTS